MFGKPMDFAEPSGRLDAMFSYSWKLPLFFIDVDQDRAGFHKEVRHFARRHRQRCIVAFVRNTVSGVTNVLFDHSGSYANFEIVFGQYLAQIRGDKVQFDLWNTFNCEVTFWRVNDSIQTSMSLCIDDDDDDIFNNFPKHHRALRGYATNWIEQRNAVDAFIKEIQVKESDELIYYRHMFYRTIGWQRTLPKDIRRLLWNLIIA